MLIKNNSELERNQTSGEPKVIVNKNSGEPEIIVNENSGEQKITANEKIPVNRKQIFIKCSYLNFLKNSSNFKNIHI